jgi:cytochrome c biogenesis protein CcmG, thiol:disulfide interchange protein DsbE
MTKKTITLSLLLIALVLSAQAQGSRQLPSVTIQTLDGTNYNARDLQNEGKPFVVSFWATWCRPCLKELTAIDEIYHEWQELGFKLIAISTDNARTRPNVLPMVNGRGWEFEFYLDENGDLQRAMGVNLIPHTFILNGKGEVVYQHTAFSDGMEWEMFDMLKDLLNADE